MTDDTNGKLSTRLENNAEQLSRQLGQSTDLVSKRLQLGEHTELIVFYIDGLIDNQLLHNSILYSLQEGRICALLEEENPQRKIEILSKRVLLAGDVTIVRDFTPFIHDLLSGNVMIMVEGSAEALRIGLPGWEDRNVSEPSSQSVVRGPMEGFTENLRTNTALLRRKIKDSQLWLETMQIGRVTQTSVSIMYLKHIASPDLVAEVKRRLNAIDTDSILESGYIEEFIQDTAVTPFPTMYNSDRPDTIAGGVLEGKSPFLWTALRLSCLRQRCLSRSFSRRRIIISGRISLHCCGGFGFWPFS